MNEELTKQIKRAMEGDAGAFEEVMEAKARQIIYISVKLMRNHQDGEDAAQEAMLKMYRHIGELKEPDAFQSWMYQIITRTCLNMKKKQGRTDHDYLETEDDVKEMRREFLPQECVEDVDKRQFLMSVIDGLPEKYRVCLLFFYYEGMSYRQIAQAMDTTEKVVENILHRARRKIKKQLEKKYGSQVGLSSFQGAAAIPVLSQVFEMDAVTIAPQEVVGRTLHQAATAIERILTGAETASSTLSTISTVSTASATSAKIVAGIVAAAAVTGGAAVAFLPEGDVPVFAADTQIQEERAILTLEDMIGQEEADRLRGYTAGTEETQQWQSFLEQLEMTAVYSAEDGDCKYTLHRLEEQDKQLMILQKSTPQQLEVVFRFTDIEEALPVGAGLVDCVEGWRQ